MLRKKYLPWLLAGLLSVFPARISYSQTDISDSSLAASLTTETKQEPAIVANDKLLKNDGIYNEVIRPVVDARSLKEFKLEDAANLLFLYRGNERKLPPTHVFANDSLLERFVINFQEELDEDYTPLIPDNPDGEFESMPKERCFWNAFGNAFVEKYGWARWIDRTLKKVHERVTVHYETDTTKFKLRPYLDKANRDDLGVYLSADNHIASFILKADPKDTGVAIERKFRRLDFTAYIEYKRDFKVEDNEIRDESVFVGLKF